MTGVNSKYKVRNRNKTHHIISSSPQNSKSKARSPETTPSNPVLTDILNIGCLRNELVHLVADTQLFVISEVSSSELLLDSGENLESTGILCLAGFLWNTFRSIEDTTFKHGWAAATGEIARWLGAGFEIDTVHDGLAAIRGERHSLGGLLCTQTPVD